MEPLIPAFMGIPQSVETQKKLGIQTYLPPVGSTIVACALCNEPAYIGPQQSKMRASRPEIPVHCVTCIKEEMKNSTEPPLAVSLGGTGGSYVMDGGKVYAPDHSKN